ncbi:Folate-biopterin transporter 1, chloroplastic, partial [Mucuna pruriens]
MVLELGSSVRFNNDDDDYFLGSHIDVEENDALTTETNLEVASSSKVASKKHKYRINNIKLFRSLCWGSSAFGGIVSSYFNGSLLDAYGVRT